MTLHKLAFLCYVCSLILHDHSYACNKGKCSVNMLQNILVCVQQKKHHHMGLKQHENQQVVVELFLNALLN